ncbi:hypothetical protein NJ76_04820 [Rhodococcus sp. IITR03]|nr:hypothetical protein NJ76_04820 [Rhodococcus sp. IITR03]
MASYPVVSQYTARSIVGMISASSICLRAAADESENDARQDRHRLLDEDRVDILQNGHSDGNHFVEASHVQTFPTGCRSHPEVGEEHRGVLLPRFEDGSDDAHHRRMQALTRRARLLDETGVVLLHPVLDGGEDQFLACREPFVDGGQRHARPARDLAQLDGVVATFLQEFDHGLEQA